MPDDGVGETPQPELAHARQQLGIDRLGQHVVERALADVGHDAAHVRFDGEADDAADEGEHAHHDQQLRARPTVELIGSVEDESEHDEPGADRHQRLDQLDREVGSGTAARSSRRSRRCSHEPAAAPFRRRRSACAGSASAVIRSPPCTPARARRHMTLTPTAPIAIHTSWRSSPSTSSRVGDRTDERGDREAERRLERQERRERLDPVGHRATRAATGPTAAVRRRRTPRRSRSPAWSRT